MFGITQRRWTRLLAVLLSLTLLPVALLAVEQFPPRVEEEEIEVYEEGPVALPPEKAFEEERETLERKHTGKSRNRSGMMLKRMDMDKDGVVDMHEIHMALEKLGILEDDMEELADRLMEYDRDDDDALSMEEFKAMNKDRPKLLREFISKKQKFKDKFDFNKNGTIDEHEWDQLREARKRFTDRRQQPRQHPGGKWQHPGSRSAPPLVPLPGAHQALPPPLQGQAQQTPFQRGMSPRGKNEVSSPAQVAAQIHQNIVKVFLTTAKRLEKAGDFNRALIVQAKLAEVEVHLAKALIRIQEKDYDEAVSELNNIIDVAKSLPGIGQLPEIQEEDDEEQEE